MIGHRRPSARRSRTPCRPLPFTATAA